MDRCALQQAHLYIREILKEVACILCFYYLLGLPPTLAPAQKKALRVIEWVKLVFPDVHEHVYVEIRDLSQKNKEICPLSARSYPLENPMSPKNRAGAGARLGINYASDLEYSDQCLPLCLV